ncbi:ExeA family protein [Phosphitispora fastidiosa]|uniref:ExeA family protein n=1 Tax=Phosphitispora fastidiosa TaxID=2837202 RepID=UPI00307FC185|nr:type II secretory pathway predicted ATPase ExeA [Phosphitispora fastidiosa]
MYESFYSLTKTPFARDIPTAELYNSVMVEEALGRLSYAAERQLFAVVTGECGIGKTTTIRRLKDMLDPGKYLVLYLADSKLTPRHFYKGLLEQLGCESKFYRGDAKRQLHREIELMKGIHRLEPVVIVDEAHLLDREMLEEVRFLLNFKMDAQSPMALILVGQNELWERFQLQSYAAIRQRIDLQCKLQHLDRAQVGAYVSRHLNYAGADHDIFSDIHRQFSGCGFSVFKRFSPTYQQTLYPLPALWLAEWQKNHR